MSNYHILEQSKDRKAVTVAFHVAVPNTLNKAGVNYRVALVQYKDLNNFVSMIFNHETNFSTENAQLISGGLYEYVQEYRFSESSISDGEKQTELDNKFTALSTNIPSRIETILEWWGFNRDIP